MNSAAASSRPVHLFTYDHGLCVALGVAAYTKQSSDSETFILSGTKQTLLHGQIIR